MYLVFMKKKVTSQKKKKILIVLNFIYNENIMKYSMTRTKGAHHWCCNVAKHAVKTAYLYLNREHGEMKQ